MSTFILVKIANNCALTAPAGLKESEGHSKIEKDLVKYYFDKLNMLKIFQTQGCRYRLSEEFCLFTDDFCCVLSVI